MPTFLFVPAHEDRKVRKALTSAADAVILDFEDAVPADRKADARAAVVRLADEGALDVAAPEVWVRVNGGETPYFEADIAAVPWDRVRGGVLPKVEGVEAVDVLAARGVSRMLLQIESMAGYAALPALGTRDRLIEHTALGTWDLSLDLGLPDGEDPDDAEVIRHLRCELVVQSRRYGIPPPLDGVYARLSDEAGFRASCQRSLRLGFAGRLLIHPNQIGPANEVYQPTASEIAQAEQIVAAAERAAADGKGALRVNDRMVDRPVIDRARVVLERARRMREAQAARRSS